MDQERFEVADRQVEKIAEILDQMLVSPEFRNLRQAFAALGKDVGEGCSVSLTCLVEVFDETNGRTLPLLNTGLCASGGREPYRTWGDSSPQRYLVGGRIQVVPHDRCLRCWGPWDFKWQNRRCGRCGAELGRDCKVLLDSDTCPHCEQGRVTASEPKCPGCGFEVDLSAVAWG